MQHYRHFVAYLKGRFIECGSGKAEAQATDGLRRAEWGAGVDEVEGQADSFPFKFDSICPWAGCLACILASLHCQPKRSNTAPCPPDCMKEPEHTHTCDICQGQLPCWESDCPSDSR